MSGAFHLEIYSPDLKRLAARWRKNPDAMYMRIHARELKSQILSGLKEYPAPRSLRYMRTGQLGKGWHVNYKVERGANLLNMTIGNTTPYAPFVQFADSQASVHAGYWQTVEQVAEVAGENMFDAYVRDLVFYYEG